MHSFMKPQVPLLFKRFLTDFTTIRRFSGMSLKVSCETSRRSKKLAAQTPLGWRWDLVRVQMILQIILWEKHIAMIALILFDVVVKLCLRVSEWLLTNFAWKWLLSSMKPHGNTKIVSFSKDDVSTFAGEEFFFY